MEFVYRFPVARGVQATHRYYIAMVPLKMLSHLFTGDVEYVPPEYRAQRRLNEARIPVISKYILDNRDSYVFSALAASIDGFFQYVSSELNENVGVLEVSMDARFLINDGQHRKAAIVEALQEDPQLGDETIPIVFFADKGLTHSQQIFTDLNKNAIKTSNSISELYDSRDHIAVMTREVVGKIGFLNTYTDKEKDMLGKYSSKLFTLNTFYTANKTILGMSRPNDDALLFLCDFWSAVAAHMLPWIDLERREITKVDIRENYIATQNVVIQALARVGAYLKKHTECDIHDYIVNLEKVNWQRTADTWLNRAIAPNGRIITNKNATILIANTLKESLGIPLSDDEKNTELKFLREVRL